MSNRLPVGRTTLFKILSITLVALFAGAVVVPSATAAPDSVLAEPFHRLYNPRTGDHYHTTSQSEVASATAAGYTYVGVGALVSTTQQAGLVPFYRLYSPGRKDRYHTIDWNEVIAAVSTQGYNFEGIGAYVYPPNSGSGIPFYRLRHPGFGDHVLMTSQAEVASAIQSGYNYEGVAANVG